VTRTIGKPHLEQGQTEAMGLPPASGRLLDFASNGKAREMTLSHGVPPWEQNSAYREPAFSD